MKPEIRHEIDRYELELEKNRPEIIRYNLIRQESDPEPEITTPTVK